MKRFVALKNFWSDETKSQYVQGMTYAVTPQLEVFLIDKWKTERLIEILDGPRAIVRGNAA